MGSPAAAGAGHGRTACSAAPAGDILDFIQTLSPQQQEAAHAEIAAIEAKALQDMQVGWGRLVEGSLRTAAGGTLD